MITVKKDESVKLALEARELNKLVHKYKYQLPNVEELMDTVGQTISEKKSVEIFFPCWTYHTHTHNYHSAQKLAFNVIFYWFGEDRRACIDLKRGFMA